MRNKNIFSYALIIFGILAALFSLLADVLGLGRSGINAAQVFVAEIGVIIALLGVASAIFQRERGPLGPSFWLELRDRMYNLPSLVWVVIGFLPAFLLSFIAPMFFAPNHEFQYAQGYLPNMDPVGNDFGLILNAARSWLQTGRTTPFVFTPLINILFAPLLLLGYPGSYYVITLATLGSYVILCLLAILMSSGRNHLVIVFIAAISIFSYGMQFELERGQSHTIALMFGVLAVYVFHKHPHFRVFAYLLFCISVQLKFYPALLVVMFVDDWRDWKNNLKRFSALGLANILLLFVLGFSYFSAFFDHMTGVLAKIDGWNGNHSISSFVFVLQDSGIGLFTGIPLEWIRTNTALISNLLYLYFFVCLLTVLINAYLKNTTGVNADLLLVCVIGGLTLPSANHDYSLPLLTAPFAMSISNWHTRDYRWAAIITILLTIIASFTYALTLFPFIYRPVYFQNSFSMLFIILTIVTLLNVAQKRKEITQLMD